MGARTNVQQLPHTTIRARQARENSYALPVHCKWHKAIATAQRGRLEEHDMMSARRQRRRGILDLHRVTIGDYIVLASSLLTLVSLFLPWFTSNLRGGDQWAFTYSEVASVVVIVLFLAVLFLVIYPAISNEIGLWPLPFATPLVFLFMGSLLVLVFTYQLGKYDCILCTGGGRGYGIWLGWIASWVFIAGAVVKWGSRNGRGV